MHFEWDDHKNAINIRKHKIDFADVPAVFDGPLLVAYDGRRDYGEDRWVGIGTLRGTIVVVVVFVEYGGDRIRIISARKANRYEQRKYREYLRY